MKKLSVLFVIALFSFVFVQSCNKNQENANPNTSSFWSYTGHTEMTARVINDLQTSYQASDFQRIVKGQPLWEEGASSKFQGGTETTLIVPVQSLNQNKIETLLLVNYKAGKLNYYVVSAKDVKTPYLSKQAWRGYIKALDKELFHAKNNSKGFKRTTSNGQTLDPGARSKLLDICITISWEDCETDEDGNEECDTYSIEICI